MAALAGLPRPLRAGTLLENMGRDEATAYYSDLAFLKPADARVLLGQAPRRDPADSPVFAAVTDPYRRCPSTSAVQRAEYADLKVYLPNDPLVKVEPDEHGA
jgi:asparagine synthase (glutamine-hydrolysing)